MQTVIKISQNGLSGLSDNTQKSEGINVKYEYSFNGSITVEADSEEDAHEKADAVLGDAYKWRKTNRCKDISIDEIHLIDEY